MRMLMSACLLLLTATVSPAGVDRSSAVGDFSFLPRVDHPTGNYPFHVTAADLNEDGYLDLVTANRLSSSVMVRLNSGAGSFPESLEFRTDAGPRWVAAGDVNNDGHVDLVTANSITYSLTILFGDGTGHFPATINYSTGFPATSVAIADANGDGYLDLVATVLGSTGLVEVFLGMGTSAFGPRRDFSVGSAPYAVAANDLNGDGRPDLAVADHNTPRVWVLLGTGTTTLFASPVGYITWTSPWGLAVGDLNADGAPDIVSANDSSPTATVFLNTGNGTFSTGTQVPVGSYPYSVAIGDLDRDSIPDLVATNDVASTLTIMAGRGDGTFTSAATLPVGSSPISVVLADLLNRGALDMAVANLGSHSMSVYLRVTGELSSVVSLEAAPSPCVYGEPVRLSVSVVPDSATGIVEFYDGNTLIGSAGLSGGAASVVASELLHGEHVLTAWYRGSTSFRSQRSAEVGLSVGLAPTQVSLQPNVQPLLQADPVWFVATVTPVPPSTGVPLGTVQFGIDDQPFGTPVALVAGSATSGATTTLAPGPHQVTAAFLPLDTLRYQAGETTEVYTVEPSYPRIVSVRDVPNDQGGKVFVTWRCRLDGPDSRLVRGYRIWRRIPPGTAAPSEPTGPGATPMQRTFGAAAEETFWEAIADLPAAQLGSYGYTAATTQDSLEGGNPYTAFLVQGLTLDSDLWFMSPPDSGYSVDNLAPPLPSPFTATYAPERVELHWAACRAADFREFRLYRGNTLAFVPGPNNLILSGADTNYVDAPAGDARVYKLLAVDIHGNSSRAATVTPEGPVAVLATLVRIEAGSGRISLLWYSDVAAGQQVTIQRRTASTPWSTVGQVQVGSDGYIPFEDASVVRGTEYAYRLGLWMEESEAFTPPVWATASDPKFEFAGVSPNPLHDGPLRVRFVLPAPAAARIEVLDIGGRRVALQEAAGLAAGPHDLAVVGAQSLPSGVYLIRFSAGPARITRRLAVVR